MDATLLSILQTIADARYGGRWSILCYGKAYRCILGATPGDAIDEMWADGTLNVTEPTTLNGALQKAISDEMLGKW